VFGQDNWVDSVDDVIVVEEKSIALRSVVVVVEEKPEV
jgi:hypothetical protein